MAEAGVTRGALYHHFADKQELLRAVVVQIQEELLTSVIEAAGSADDPWEQFVAGWFAILDAADQPGFRVLMVEAPPVLGMEAWVEIDDRYCFLPAVAGVRLLVEQGVVAPQPPEPLARVLLTSSNALATYIASSGDPSAARDEVGPVWRRMLESVKADHGSAGAGQW